MKMKFTYTIITALIYSLFLQNVSMAGPLSLSQQALEIREGNDPNIVILMDDSGSMDFEVITEDADNGYIYSGNQPDGSLDGDGTWLAIYDETEVSRWHNHYSTDSWEWDPHYCQKVANHNGYFYGWQFENSTYPYKVTSDPLDPDFSCHMASFNMWRFRNKDFNTLYYDPDKTYEPWPGVNAAGNTFNDILPKYMPENPYPELDTSVSPYSVETISIEVPYYSWWWNDTVWTLDEEYLKGADWYKIHPMSQVYYDWTDADGDGLFDDGEETEHGITEKTTEEQQNFANWFGYYRSRELVAKGILAKTLDSVSGVNIAYATLNNATADNLPLSRMNPSTSSGNKKTLFDKIFSTVPVANTIPNSPLRVKLDEVGKYFECTSGNIFGASGSDCPLAAVTAANSCRQNYAIVITDGAYDDSFSASIDADSDGTSSYDGGAFDDNTSPKVRDSLADIAMHYYERDLSSSNQDNVPVTLLDINRSTHVAGDSMHQHMSTYIIGFGVNGTITSEPSDYNTAFTWTDPSSDQLHKIDDLRHAAYNGRGLYLNANNPEELEDSLSAIFETIGVGTASSSSVALNTQSLEQGSKIFRAFYNAQDYTGDLIALEISPDGEISDTEEWSAAANLDTKIANGTRNIISYKKDGTNSSGIAFASANMTAAQVASLESPTPNCIAVDPSTCTVDYSTNSFIDDRIAHITGDPSNEGSNFNNAEFRERFLNDGRLGDIIHSSPVFVGKPHGGSRDSDPYPISTGDLYSEFYTSKQNRTQMLYIGANDGMLHGFNAESGNEVFAYVPGQMYDSIGKLTNPDYVHSMYVDLTPSIEDAYIKTTATGTSQEWATVLVGGYRAGGKGYFALNVTDPTDFNTTTTTDTDDADDQVMWEFTDADDSDLGYSYSESFIGMTNAESGTTSSADTGEVDGGGTPILTTINNKQWAVIFGNGYNSSSADGDAALFILKLDGGLDHNWTNDYIKISTGIGKAESIDGTTPNGISGIRAVDYDGNGTVDLVYAGDYQGNLFRFDLRDTDPTNWDVTLIFSAQVPTTTVTKGKVTTTTIGTDYPITVKPFVVPHPEGDAGVIVVAATGSWIQDSDATSTKIESLYGIHDDLSASPLVDKSDLVEQEFTVQTNTINGYKIRELSSNTINWNTKKGWFIDLDDYENGERALQLQTRGGIGFAVTITPKSTNSCGSDMESWILAFDPATGGVPENVVFDLNNDGVFDDSDRNGSDVVAGIGMGQSVSPTTIIGNLMIIPLNDGDLKTLGVDVNHTALDGRISWRQLEVPAGAY